MRPGNQSNKRMRGRGRKGPNPLTRTYESNGPDVKIRGTAMHVAEKYQQLARDAQASGDRVMFESYNQHAEHYLRIVAAAQPQQQPAAQQQAPRNEAEEGQDTATSANTPAPVNGSERPSQDRAAPERVTADGDVVDADSPQPFIEDMPVIDQEGQVNGAGQNAEGDDAEADEKPRRRTRTPRTRTPRRTTSEAVSEDAPVATADGSETGNAESEDEKPKTRRRTTRPRRTKSAEEAPTEAATVTE
ncbi:MAG: DUF4167 domain-containing protein [Roseibium sp.]|uniref:DUF4167 domain-containing protein n=1 Tax=Roseibium sp. TaxID=1936156 RepID=UPI0026298919|nr:DUF4167 domain-containing protein [Roseibium sp.]MCV0424538.1 DUF4167 domain-containing protein [Roseibium sp.]